MGETRDSPSPEATAGNESTSEPDWRSNNLALLSDNIALLSDNIALLSDNICAPSIPALSRTPRRFTHDSHVFHAVAFHA